MRRWRQRRLHHQLFAWLAISILTTVMLVALVLRVITPGEPPFATRARQVSDFAAQQFAERWQDRVALSAFAHQLADAFGATLWLSDRDGNVLVQAGPALCRGLPHTLDVRRGGLQLGQVRLCLNGQQRFGALTGLLVLGTVCLVLWTAAALLARRITRPLSVLIGTTREIGSGNLSARVRLGRHQRGELGLLAESVNDMAQRIERQMRDQRELLAAVSHEVRSPLARLRVCTEILRGDAGNAALLDSVEREVMELDTLVGKLLASSRLDFEMLSRKQVVAAELFLEVLERKNLPATLLEDRTGGASVDVDPTLIARALDNLLENALRHGAGVTRCVLALSEPNEAGSGSASQPKQGVAFEVYDHGPGFTPDALPRVFEAFYRGATGSHSEPGSLGLGLALVRRIAQAHGGRAWAENLAGNGALVAFSVETVLRPKNGS